MRYRYTSGDRNGQFVSQRRIEELTQTYIEQNVERVESLANDLLSGNLTVSEWEEQTAQTLKNAHMNAFALGRGGIGQLSQRDYGIMGQRLQVEYTFLRNFANEVLDAQLSEAQILDRARKYADSIYTSQTRGRHEAHVQDGYNWERDLLDDAAEHCDPCVEYFNRGWVPIGDNPPIGSQRDCRSRCRCRKEYSRETDQPTNSFTPIPRSPYRLNTPLAVSVCGNVGSKLR